MRLDVAAAFDRMAAAARQDGISLVITSGLRSDAEQAELFAQNPDPTWVAPSGKSLHRCATELDLGPPSAGGGAKRAAVRLPEALLLRAVARRTLERRNTGLPAGPEARGGDGAESRRLG